MEFCIPECFLSSTKGFKKSGRFSFLNAAFMIGFPALFPAPRSQDLIPGDISLYVHTRRGTGEHPPLLVHLPCWGGGASRCAKEQHIFRIVLRNKFLPLTTTQGFQTQTGSFGLVGAVASSGIIHENRRGHNVPESSRTKD